MSYYAIGIGSTGDRCIESLVHLAAAGMMPDGDLHILLIDPDIKNGSIKRVKDTIKHYVDCKSNLELGNIDFLKTNIKQYEWSPLEDTRHNLKEIFNYSGLNLEQAELFNFLFSRKERSSPLNMGFFGHPAIGAAVFENVEHLEKKEPWLSLSDEIRNDKSNAGINIFLFGSAFGGVGASGFVKIAEFLHDIFGNDNPKSMKIGGVLLLPYFDFSREEDEADYFSIETQSVLKYLYSSKKIDKIYDSIYLLGNDAKAEVDFCAGGEKQDNNPHFIESIAALAGIDFFGNSKLNSPNKYFVLGRNSSGQLEWEDFPDNDQGQTIRSKINHLIRFSVAYLFQFAKALADIQKKGKSYRFPWFVNLFEREGLTAESTEAKRKQLENYCLSFTRWVSAIQESDNSTQINLVNLNVLDIDNYSNAFDNMVFPVESHSQTITDIFDLINDIKVSDKTGAVGFGKFIHALYKVCKPN